MSRRPRSRHVLSLLVVLAAAAAVPSLVAALAQQPADPSSTDGGPSEAELHRTRGVLAWKEAAWIATPEALEEPIQHLEQAHAAQGENADFTVVFLLGYSYLRRGRRDEALRFFHSAQQALPKFVGFALLDGIRLEDEGKHEESAAALQAFLERESEIAEVGYLADEFRFLGHLHRGQALLGMFRNDEAMKELETALAISEEKAPRPSASAKVLLARSQVATNQFAVAEALLLEVVAAAPDEAMNYYHLGVIYADQQRHDDARHWYALAVKHAPGFARAHLKLAYLARVLNDLPGCRRHLETYDALTLGDGTQPRSAQQTADVESGFGQYWNEVGNARLLDQDEEGAREAYARAVRHLRRALAERPDCKAALSTLIQLLFAQGDETETERKTLNRRLRELQEAEDGAPPTERSTFC